MFYKFTNDRDEIIGLVCVEPSENGSATITSVDPPEFKEYLESEVFRTSSHFLDAITNKQGAADGTPNYSNIFTIFDKTRMDHWHALPKIFNVRNGYGGVEEYTDEEVRAALEDLLEPADADSTLDEGEESQAAHDDGPDEVGETGESGA